MALSACYHELIKKEERVLGISKGGERTPHSWGGGCGGKGGSSRRGMKKISHIQ